VAAAAVTPSLILPPRYRRRKLPDPNTIVRVAVPVGAVFAGARPTEAELVQTLTPLCRDDVIFECAMINALVSGLESAETRDRQQVASEVVCCRREVDAINAFARAQGDGQPPEVFFRGQMLELMRWAARHCRKTDGDGRSFDDPSVRSAFVKAALIASEIWSRRVYRDAFEIGERDDAEARRRAMGAIRKGIEESNPAPHLGFLMGRGRQLFTHYLPRELPAFPDLFKEETGLAIDEYFVAAAGLAQYAFSRRGVGPLFNFASVADQTTSQATIRKFIDLESQRADDLEGRQRRRAENVFPVDSVGNTSMRDLAQERFLNRQLVLPVSTISQWCVSRSSMAVVILASPNTCGQSAKARLVVISSEVFS
jgi:hypothetical protein